MSNDVELSRVNSISHQNLLNLSEINYKRANNNEIEIENKEKYRCLRKDRKTNNYIIIPLHLVLHIIFLSIFEISIYFHYITNIENKVFMDRIGNYINKVIISDKVNDPTISSTINYELNTPNAYNYYNNLELYNDQSVKQRNSFNTKLEHNSYIVTYILAVLFIFYSLVTIFKYKLNLIKLISEHIILILCIALYEIWFFYNVILKYKLLDSDEINFTVISCLLKKLNNEPNIYINSSIINYCNLL